MLAFPTLTSQLEFIMSRPRTRFFPATITDLHRRFPDLVPAEIVPEAPKLAPVVSFDPLTQLTTLQQVALLWMHVSHVRHAVTAKLMEDAQDRPGKSDWAALRDHGLCEYKEGKRQHDLTGEGRVAVIKLERELCRKFGIHLISYGGNATWEQFCSCSCGGWTRSFKRGRGTNAEINQSFGRHLDSVKGVEGVYAALKPPRRA